MAVKTRIKDYIDLFRFSLAILSCFALLAASFITYALKGGDPNFVSFLFNNGVVSSYGLVLAMIAVLLLASGVEAINDVYDVETDIANKRFDRPIARGAFTKEYVRNLSLIFFLITIIISIILVATFQVTVTLIFFTLISVFIGIGYNYIKRTGFIGNMWVSIGYVIPLFLGFFLLKPQDEVIILNCVLMLTATFFLATGREIVKDIQDYEGDQASNLNSLAVKIGPIRAALIAMVFFTMAVICAFFAGFFVYKNLIFWLFFIALIIILIITSVTIVTEPPASGGKKARKYTRWSLWWALAAFFFGVFFIN